MNAQHWPTAKVSVNVHNRSTNQNKYQATSEKVYWEHSKFSMFLTGPVVCIICTCPRYVGATKERCLDLSFVLNVMDFLTCAITTVSVDATLVHSPRCIPSLTHSITSIRISMVWTQCVQIGDFVWYCSVGIDYCPV